MRSSNAINTINYNVDNAPTGQRVLGQEHFSHFPEPRTECSGVREEKFLLCVMTLLVFVPFSDVLSGRTHDSDTTPVIVNLIPTLAKSEPLDSAGVEIFRRRSHPASKSAVTAIKIESESGSRDGADNLFRLVSFRLLLCTFTTQTSI